VAALGLLPLLLGLSIQVVPAEMAGVRVSQISGTLPGTLYAGFHLVVPLVQTVQIYDVRDQIFEPRSARRPRRRSRCRPRKVFLSDSP
jgi:hypothetical protein